MINNILKNQITTKCIVKLRDGTVCFIINGQTGLILSDIVLEPFGQLEYYYRDLTYFSDKQRDIIAIKFCESQFIALRTVFFKEPKNIEWDWIRAL